MWVILISGLLFSSFQCEKMLNESPPIKMKLVASFCAYHIVQIQDSAYYSQGMNWTNSQGTAFQHVFAVKNPCDFARSGIRVGDEFTASITDRADSDNCTVCLGYMETPPLQHAIKVQ
jgi:hypothetical protein